MDAGIIIAPPPPPTASAGEAAPDTQGAHATSFADHLPQDAKPPSRKPARKATEESIDGADGSAPAQPPTGFALTVAAAPVAVRLNASPALTDVAFAAAPTIVAPAIESGAPPASHPLLAAPATAPTSSANVDAAAPAPDLKALAPTPPPQATTVTPTQTQIAHPPAEAALLAPPADLVAVATLPAKPAPAPAEPLRVNGRARAERAETPAIDAPRATPGPAPAAVVAAATRNAANHDAATPAPVPIEAPPPSTPATESAIASGDTRRLAEQAASVVHRPPSPAATVAQQIVRRFDGQSTSIDVRLDPAELGAVHVKLDVGADQRVTAIVAADNPATLADLMRSARDLERALESAGLELASGGLSFNLSDRRGAQDRETDLDPATLRGSSDENVDTAPAPASRPFGLETWRGVRVDMTV